MHPVHEGNDSGRNMMGLENAEKMKNGEGLHKAFASATSSSQDTRTGANTQFG
jgi:hypothetical protein